MPGFSFTAPVVTPEEERQEREQLSKEELDEIENDVHGLENDDLVKNMKNVHGKELVLEALRQIPTHEKKDVCEAFKRVPNLVEKESSPAAFLRCENNNAMVRMWRVNIIFELGRNRVCMKFFRDEYSH